MKNMSLKSKLISLSVFLVTISVVIGGVSYWGLQNVIHNYSAIADVNYPNTASTLEMYSNFRSNRLQAFNAISSNLPLEERKSAVKRMIDNLKTDKELDEEYRSVPFQPGEGELYLEFRKHVDDGNARFVELADAFNNSKGDQESIDKMNEIVYKKIAFAGNNMREPIEKLRKFHFSAADVSKDLATKSADQATKASILLIVILGAVGLVSAYFFSSMLTKSLKTISEILNDSSTQVSEAAGQIASASEELSQAVTEQSASLQETSASVEELSSMVKVNTENAKKASDNSNLSKGQAEKGRAVVEEMVQSMAMINESNNNIMNQINYSNEQMSEIVKVIQEIETKTKVINDIVFQTKLLSFNASVEAARAGEQGKGFAVVAEEVGNLAQMSGNAAKEISDMLSASVHKVESIVTDTKSKVDVLISDGKEKVANGTRVAEECGEVLKEIVHNVTNVTTMASEISVASDEQSRGIVEITKAMGQLDQVTQSNSATSDQAAHAAGELSAQADTLKNQVVSLVSLINGEGKSSVMPSKAVVKEKTFEKAPEKKASVPAATNVLPMKKMEDVHPVKKMEKAPEKVAVKAPAKPAQKPQPVVVAKKDTKVVAKVESAPIKKASGSDLGLPSHDHPGFEDV